ncbi:hypothetical protein Nepgr_018478 [Nepenthes gracilis]|uniref:Uncharacterized protein n=1 Tax=Nepenthes gracilis TaxID=150966 RepID=A0AAD3SU36_NEPGR|nr:hypothetical protein Nepgr_018478 [Nepenthes gracilis]
MGRAPCCDKANVKKGPWSPEEDAKLKAYIEKHGTGGNWIALPQKMGIKRCGKSCRLRWLNYLRPNIKHGGFTEEEDNIICSLYISIGSRWSIIAAQLPGRTDNDIKNYWNTKLKKKLLGRRKHPSRNHPKDDGKADQDGGSSGGSYLPTLSSSALERLQLHMQLQSIQNPLPFCNPALLPKLHPLQEKMIQNLQSLDNPIKTSTNLLLPPSPQKTGHDSIKCGPATSDGSMVFNGGSDFIDSSLSAKISDYNAEMQMQMQAELNELILNNNNNGQSADDQLDCLRDMDVSKESMMSWWCNELSSWDSTASVFQYDHQGVFQDFPLGYSMK